MHEISPVLAGSYDSPNYIPAKANFNAAASASADTASAIGSSSSSASSVDQRRYTKFDRTASDAGSTTNFTFSDFLDAINPLQHIPVVSSIYREVTGESIHPVARVAGDMLYGGILGAPSVVLGGLGAVGNSLMESQTGKDTAGYVVSSLFGDQKTEDGGQKTQLASANPAPASQTPAPQVAAAKTNAPPPVPDAQLASAAADAAKNALQTQGGKLYPLNPGKQPYGGVMAPLPANMQDQNTVIALSEGSRSMRLGNTIYTGRLMNGAHPPPAAAPVPAASVAANAPTNPVAAAVTPPPSDTPSLPSTSLPADSVMASGQPGASPIPQGLMDDMVMMKALNQYNNLAGISYSNGMKLDVAN